MHKKWFILVLLVVLFSLGYLFLFINGNALFALKLRTIKWSAILLTGCAIGFSTVIFQTITNNRILTPSVIGLDSLYMLFQTVLLFFFGSGILALINPKLNFIFSVSLMICFSFFLYYLLFKRSGTNIYFLLLMGIIFGTFFKSISSFMEVLIDPNEFQVLQDKSFASFNNVNTSILSISFVIMLLFIFYLRGLVKYLDVLVMGKDGAINLGIHYEQIIKKLLVIVVIFISVATALVGPITFLGLIVTNISYQFFDTYKHRILLPGAALFAVLILLCGQLIAERIFTFKTPISVLINLIGGIYFLYLLIKGRRLR